MTRRTYGTKGVFIRTVVELVMVLYAKAIWGHKASIASNKKILIATQRPFLRAAVKAYRTPTGALLVLNRTPSWWLDAKVASEEYRRNYAHIMSR